MSVQPYSRPQTTPQLLKAADSLLEVALSSVPAPSEKVSPEYAGLLALIAQAATDLARAKIEHERSRSFIAVRGCVINVEDIASMQLDIEDIDMGPGVLIVARTPVTRLDESGRGKMPATKTYKFFGAPGAALKAWLLSTEFFERFVTFDAGGDTPHITGRGLNPI